MYRKISISEHTDKIDYFFGVF